MKRLIEASMEVMYEKKMPFTYLMPVKEGIYLPFDFRVVYEQAVWNQQLLDMQSEEREKDEESTKGNYQFLILETDETDRIKDLVSFTNKSISHNYDIFVKRDSYYYERLIKEMKSSEGEVFLVYKENTLIGYLSYMAEEFIYITELIAYREDERQVFRLFLDYISAEDHLKNKKIFKKKEGSQKTVIMARIINLCEFVKTLRTKTPLSFVADIRDPIIEENQGKFLIEIDEDGGSIDKTSKEPDMSITIADLTSLFFGQVDKKDLGKIKFYANTFINDVV